MASLGWNIYDHARQRRALALETARTFLTQLKNTRDWIAGHDGIWVMADPERSQPSPLKKGPDDDLLTRDGRRMTRISPATMIRELSLIAAKKGKATFHLTSLDPVNPENRPRQWERKWLDDFREDPREKSAVIRSDNGLMFRYMAPLFVRKECLQCHTEKNFSLGEIRGGVSITLPMSRSGINWPLWISHLASMAGGVALILFFSSRINSGRRQLISLNRELVSEIAERRKAEKALQKARDHLEKKVMERTLELSSSNRHLNRKIHQQAHIEQALTAIYDEFFQLFNSAPDSMLVVDHHFEILRVNQAFVNLVGSPANQIIGEKCSRLFHGPTCGSDQCPVQRIINGEKRVQIESDKVLFGSKKTIPCIITSTPFMEPDGTLIGAILVITDISTQKKTEQALARSTARLMESNRALEDFAHVISHDLQEPLMLIEAFSQRLQEKAAADLSPQCNRYLDQTRAAAGRMRELITGLLLYSRVERAGDPLEEVDLNRVVRGALADLAVRIEESGSHITLDELPTVPGNALLLRQLFQNLIGNSLKYRHPDREHRIHIRNLGQEPDPSGHPLVRLSIRDNGIGFDPEDKEKIFSIFTRLESGSHREGSGVGLAICKRIVYRHGGRIEATGKPGQGAEFTVWLAGGSSNTDLLMPGGEEEKSQTDPA